MEKKAQIRALTALLIKRSQSTKQMLALLMLQWRNNMQLISVIAGNKINLMQGLATICSHSTSIKRRSCKFDRNGNFWEYEVPKMDEKMFKDNFRVSKTSFRKICAAAKNMAKRDKKMKPCIPLDKRVAIALYMLGSSVEYKIVSRLFGVSYSTAAKILMEFCHIVTENFKNYISSYPPTPAEIKRIVQGFTELGFPQCYGAIDSCHIEIQPGKEDAADYYNNKDWYSTILLAACDHTSKFTYTNIGSAGKINDSYIFENSSLKKCHESDSLFIERAASIGNVNVPVLLVGDSTFPLSRFLMKPYPIKSNQPANENVFNYRLQKCHWVIVNAFRELKARFRRIEKGLNVAPRNCNVIIKACCLLHNFLKDEADEVPASWLQEAQEKIRLTQPSSIAIIDNNVDGKAIRDAIATSFEDMVTHFKQEEECIIDESDIGSEN